MVDRKKSNFPALTAISGANTLDFVTSGVNYKITYANFIAGLGVTGTLAQSGSVTGAPVLDTQATVNNIRNLENGSGVKVSISPENGLTVAHNFLQDTNGIAVLRNAAALQPTFLSLFEGNGIDLSLAGNQLTISSSAALPASKVVTVNQISDFPASVSGVITLEANTAYLISNEITTSSRFVVQSGGAVVGYSFNVARLTYTGSGTMFTGVNARVDFSSLLLSCPSAKVFDMSETGGGSTVLFRLISTVIESCDTFGDFADLFGTSISDITATCATRGAVYTGTGWSIVSYERSAIFSPSAGFVGIDLGSITSNIIEMSDLFLAGPAGSIGVSGLPNSGNITAGNLGTITGANFIGDITPEGGGLDAQNDIRWEATGNDGIGDTRPDALGSIFANATETVIASLSTDGTNAVLWAGTFTLSGASHFTVSAAGRITYNGERAFTCPIDITVNVLMASGGTKNVSAYLCVNGTIERATEGKAAPTAALGDSCVCQWQHTFLTGHYIEVFLENQSDATNIVGVSGVVRAN
jgi:hypothetical protein